MYMLTSEHEAYHQLRKVGDGVCFGTVRVGLCRRRRYWAQCWAISNIFGGYYGTRADSLLEAFEGLRHEIIDVRQADT